MTDDNVPEPTAEVTQRMAPMPGFHRFEVGTAGMGQSGPNVRVVSPTVWEYLLIDVGAFAYVTGWITTSAFYGAGDLEAHGLEKASALSVLGYISLKALIPAAILAAKDLASWLHKRRQAHGLA